MTKLPLASQAIWVMAKGYAPDEGGMQSYAQGVAEAYAAAGADVTVFGQSDAGPREVKLGPVRLIDVGPGKSLRVPLLLLQAMRLHLRSAGHPALVHGTTWRTSILPLLLNLPFVTTFHGREFMAGGELRRLLMLNIARRAIAIVTVSRFSADRLRARLGPQCPDPMILWNGLSVGFEDISSREDEGGNAVPTILSLCRLEERKNIAACVRACAVLHREGIPFRYMIAGRGPEYDTIRALVNELDLADVVQVLGRVSADRVAELYREADIFLHPQIEVDGARDFEGFGITIADAMAQGIAVIAGNAGGPAEIIEDGVTGLLVNGERDQEIVAALRRLLMTSVTRDRLASRGRKQALDYFRWDKHVAAILARAALLPGAGE